MVSADITSPPWAMPRRFLYGVSRLRLPIRAGRFWLVQAGVLLVAVL
ncbi:MAG: hypothetical protein QOF35_525, partial [Actinomycetota bacterium]|nr:hypothetical protein [Actinomycetota bacterium]